MDTFWGRYKNALVLMMLLLVQIVGLAVQVRRPALPVTDAGGGSVAAVQGTDQAGVSVLRSWVVAVVTPVERVVHGTGTLVRQTWWNYLDLRHARSENADLRHELDRMRIEQAGIAEDAVQAHRLQAVLGFQEHYVSRTVAAQVIGTSGTDRSRVVYLDKGAADGLRQDMAVITPDGIVGKVRAVFPERAPHAAQVLLLDDQTSGAGVILEKTRIRAVLRGTTSGGLEINNLAADDRIQPGETVVTSGGDGIFPRGLPVGTVESMKPDPANQPYSAIQVRPAANLSRLDEVLVITGTEPTLPAATLQSLAKGAAATAQARVTAQKQAEAKAAADEAAREEAARSAAEIVADRLPSLRDPNETEAQRAEAAKAAAAMAASPKTAGGKVPVPLQPQRLDRYSPGTAPPATSLVPGARGTGPVGGEAVPAEPRRRPAVVPPAETVQPGAEATPKADEPPPQ